MAISLDDARKVARLARIKVDEQELPAIQRELSAILAFMERLREADVDGVEPMTSVSPMRVAKRADKVETGGCRDEILSNAPDAREGFFVVPKVVE